MLRIIRKLSANIWVPALWTIITIFLLCIPGSEISGTGVFSGVDNFDKLVHLILFGGIVVLWGSYSHLRDDNDLTWFKAICGITLGVIVLGIFMEYIQFYFVENRDFERADIVADIAGAIGALGYLIMVRRS